MKFLYKTFSEHDCDQLRDFMAEQGLNPEIRYSQQVSTRARSVYYEYEFYVPLEQYLNAQSALNSYLKSQQESVSKATKEFHKSILFGILAFLTTLCICLSICKTIDETALGISATIGVSAFFVPSLLKRNKLSQSKSNDLLENEDEKRNIETNDSEENSDSL